MTRDEIKKIVEENRYSYRVILKKAGIENSFYDAESSISYAEQLFIFLYGESSGCAVCSSATRFKNINTGYDDFCGVVCVGQANKLKSAEKRKEKKSKSLSDEAAKIDTFAEEWKFSPMTDEELVDAVCVSIPNEKHRKLPLLYKNDPKIHTFVMQRTAFLGEDANLSKRILFIRSGMNGLVTCPICNVEHERVSWDNKEITAWCSEECMYRDKDFTVGRLRSVDQKAAAEKRAATLLAATGYEYNAQNPVNTETLKYWSIKNHNPVAHACLINKDWLESEYIGKTMTVIAKELGVNTSTVRDYINSHGIETRYDHFQSQGEIELGSYLTELNVQFEANRRNIIGYELDVFIPEHKLAIEYNGIFYHRLKKKGYHQSKMVLCQNRGISLLQITSQDWQENKELVKAMIRSRLGMNHKVSARKCEVVRVDAKTHWSFCKENHISGPTNFDVAYGLELDGVLLQVMSFGKPRFDDSYDWELIRQCSKRGVTVVGGSSKLFARKPKGSIISYCDLQYGTGKVYEKMGMRLVSRKEASFKWADRETLYSWMKFQKHTLKKQYEEGTLSFYDEKLTFLENMKRNGYEKYFDAGHDVWVFTDEP